MAAKDKNIDLIGITDHNSTLHCSLVKKLANRQGIEVLFGVEVTTREEVHCLAYFRDEQTLELFQNYLDHYRPSIPYLPGKFGYQALVDENEQIIQLFGEYLNVGLNQSIDLVEQEVHRLGGLFVPAHIERPMFGIYSQMGFVPDSLVCDAMGIMHRSSESSVRQKYRLPASMALLKASDAHSLNAVGAGFSWFEMEEITFDEIKMALKGIDGRKIATE
jgi:PHP family Zn ribbon phosphoesterase